MNWADLAILGVVGVSVAISLWRGFTREAFSLAGWVAAVWVALGFAAKLDPMLESFISVPSARLAAAFALLFFATLIIAGVVNYLAVQLVKKTGLSGTDRMIGVFFGIGRGCAVVAVLVLLAGLTPLPGDPWWSESMLLRYFVNMAVWLRDFLPAEVAERIRFG